MDKLWLKNYEEGVPETINPDIYSSLVEMAQKSFQQYSTKPCFANLGTVLFYHQIDELSQAFAGFLQQHCKLSKGDRVALVLPNILQYPVAMFGALRANCTVVCVNPLYTARELRYILQDSGATCVVILDIFAHVLQQVLPETKIKHVIVTRMGDLLGPCKGRFINFALKYIKRKIPPWTISHAYFFKDAIQKSWCQIFQAGTIGPEDIAYLQYTGGTTGEIHGAMLTHRNIIANILQASSWIQPLLKRKEGNANFGGIITALPMYHIFSLLANCWVFFCQGIENILITNPRDISGFIKELQRQPFSFITGVNTLFNALLRSAKFNEVDFSNFILSLGGGMAVQKAVAIRWKEMTGTPLIEAYGLTEASPAVTINPMNLKDYNGTIGLPIPSTEVKICDEAENELGLNEVGELCVRGPQVMKGYWNQPILSAKVLSVDGWLHTGDLATIDDKGFVRLVDRKKDIIIVSGFNVYPNEVEDVIAELKGVREVAVVGMRSASNTEFVKAFIVPEDPHLTEEEIFAHCKKELTGYKIPKEIEFRKELPKSNVGKVLRRALREEVITDNEKK